MIVGSFTKIAQKKNSHSFGWARTWSENLGVEIDFKNQVHSKVYLLHGANFGGSLNLFGGFDDELKNSIDNLMQSNEIISLDIDMPDYGEMLKKRKDVVDKAWCDRITAKLSTAKTLVSSDLEFDWLAVGDSHTAAYSRNNSAVVKQDGTTLFNQVESNFEYLRHHIDKMPRKGVTISLGNIDVRHHFLRVNSDWRSMYDKLFLFGDELKTKGIEVEYSLPWPIEFVDRKLPKTGYYKDRPFWGEREARVELVYEIWEFMARNGVSIVKPPEEWYKMDPEQYADEKMEKPKSVHLSPEFYRRKNWGIPETTLEGFFA